MEKYGIPTAPAQSFTDFHEACAHIEHRQAPFVIKADGLAAGKGVTIAKDLQSAREALDFSLRQGGFGSSGKTVLIEEFLEGEEISVFALCDGKKALPFLAAQDHKRACDQTKGPIREGWALMRLCLLQAQPS